VDEGVSMAHLRGALTDFMQRFFEQDDLKLRFRPSYFRSWNRARKWISAASSATARVAGVASTAAGWKCWAAGWCTPTCSKACKIDPERYTGWAFGMGVERMGMLRYGIDDIRMNYDNDLRFLPSSAEAAP